MTGIRQWLRTHGLDGYAELFEREQIDLPAARHLTEAALKELGLPMGPRLKLLAAIRELADAPAAERGEAVGTDVPRAPSHESPRHAERRQLTVMFCDLVGSTALAGRLDPEEWRDVMRAYQSVCGETAARFDGHVAQYLGDGVMVYFGWPRAHEDDAERAVRAAIAIREEVERVRAPDPLQVRVGIATGLVVVGETGGGDASVPKLAVGETPNLASRVQGLAAPDEIVVAPGTRRLLGAAFELEDMGEHVLRGIVEPVNAWRVLGARRVSDRFEASRGIRLAPLVGRDSELALLDERWRQAVEGDGQVVILGGEPGVGKSRLARALRGRLEGEPHNWVQYQCSPFFINTALHPVVAHLERAAGLSEGEPVEAKLGKLEALLSWTGAEMDDAPAVLAALLSLPAEDRYPPLYLSPQRQKERTLDILVSQLASLASARPVVVVFEDVHWMDPTTRELVDQLVARAAGLRMLVLVTHRPDLNPPWGAHAHVTRHSLNRLSRRQSAALAAGVAAKPLPEALLAQIVDKTDGVPLFVEELTKAVLESDVLVDAGDRYALSGTAEALRVPATLRDSLMARLDRFLPVREVAQIGAAIGREFSYEILAAVSSMEEAALRSALDGFVHSELIHQRGSPPLATYVFKHALVQDAAYDSLLKRHRAEIHARIAEALERRGGERAEPEIIAHHHAAAGDAEKAAPFWLEAGARSVARAAHQEAVAHLTRGLDLLRAQVPAPRRDQIELQFLLALANALLLLADNPRAIQAFEAAAGMARTLGDAESLASAALGLGEAFHRPGLASEGTIALLEEARDALGEEDTALRTRVLAALARNLGDAGVQDRARAVGDQAVAAARRLGDPVLLAVALRSTLSARGRWEPETLERTVPGIRQALPHLERLPDKALMLEIFTYDLTLSSWLGDMPRVAAATPALSLLVEEARQPFFTYFAALTAACLAFFHGRLDEAEALARRALAVAEHVEGVDPRGMFGVYMFSLRREQGRLGELAPLVKHFAETTPRENTWRPGLALIYAEMGLLEEARAEFAGLAADDFAAVPEDHTWINCMAMLAEVCCAVGDRDRADVLYRFLLPYARCNVVAPPIVACYGVAARHLGMLAAAMNRWEDAERHFEMAIELNNGQGGRPWVAYTQHAYAAMLLARKGPADLERARALSVDAAVTARALGMRALIEHAEALSARLEA